MVPESSGETKHISLSEYDESDDCVELTQQDQEILDNTLSKFIGYYEHGCEEYKITSKQYAGIVTLPSEVVIEVNPKAAGKNALHLITYAYRTGELFETDGNVGMIHGSELLQPAAASFADKFTALSKSRQQLDSNYRREYRSSGGRLNTQAVIDMKAGDLSAQNRMFIRRTTDFNTELNQILLAAAKQYLSAIHDDGRKTNLKAAISLFKNRYHVDAIRRPEMLLRNFMHKNHQEPYNTLLELSEIVVFDDNGIDLSPGKFDAYSYFIDMNRVFEEAIERAMKAGLEEFEIQAQYQLDSFDGPVDFGGQPDTVVRRSEVVLMATDAKWQTEMKNSDFDKMLRYHAALDVPCIMIYPEDEEDMEGDFDLADGSQIAIIQVPVRTDDQDDSIETYDEFTTRIETAVVNKLTPYIEQNA